MSYTNIELVSRYLAESFPTRRDYFDQPLSFSGDDFISFYNGAVESSTLKVKSIQSNELSEITFVLQEGGNQISELPLLRGSVLVASDSSQTVIYVENSDFIVDYLSGTLFIKEGGALVIGQSVTVWFQVYMVYSGTDYSVDFQKGRIKRLLSGGIADRETVFLDYRPVENNFDDNLLLQAVNEANSMIESEIDPENQFGANLILQAAATNRALEMISFVAASRALSTTIGNDKTALVWIKLGEIFSKRADRLIGSFRPPYSGPAVPAHS